MTDSCPICFCPDWEFFANTFDRILNCPEQLWEIRRCLNCGFGWTVPSLDEEELAPHYPASYLGETAKTIQEFLSGSLQRSRSWRREVEKVQLVERRISSGRMLDVGCGDAKFLWALDPNKWRRTGVDRDAKTLQTVGSQIPDLTLLQGSVFSDQLAEHSFDAITFWHVFEHLSRPREVMKRTHELLRPGGWVFISVPNFVSLQTRLFRQNWYALDAPRHLWHFGPASLEILLKENGLQVCEHTFFSPMANFHSLKYSMIYWSEARFRSRLPYYILKPLLLAFTWLERWSGQYGTLTTIGHKPIIQPRSGTKPDALES